MTNVFYGFDAEIKIIIKIIKLKIHKLQLTVFIPQFPFNNSSLLTKKKRKAFTKQIPSIF